MNNWKEKNNQLKIEILEWAKKIGMPKDKVKLAIEFIVNHAETEAQIALECGDKIDCQYSSEDIEGKFSPQYKKQVLEFIAAKAQLELEAIKHIESQRTWKHLAESARDDFEYEDWKATEPDAEIVIYPDRIEAKNLKGKGVGDRLPKSRKYDGAGTWTIPLSQLDAVQKSGYPVIYHPGC